MRRAGLQEVQCADLRLPVALGKRLGGDDGFLGLLGEAVDVPGLTPV
jgi:hypothetical protein